MCPQGHEEELTLWILLTQKIPARPSPPRLAIFWSVPWPGAGQFVTVDSDYELVGQRPDWDNARRIRYEGQDIRVFPHEFRPVPPEEMSLFINGEDGDAPSHYLVSEAAAEDQLVRRILEDDLRPIYDAALLDGCTEAQAMMTALEMDVTTPDAVFPPIGWYRCHPAYATAFCKPWEMEEDGGVGP